MNQQNKPLGDQITNSLNKDCHCISLDRDILHRNLEAHLSESGLPEQLLDIHRQLFADAPVFLAGSHMQTMKQVISVLEDVVRNEHYRERVFSSAPGSARCDLGPKGVFFGYDFHLGVQGPQLIEINTNAGGVLLNLYLATAQRACCDEVGDLFGGNINFADAEGQMVDMFREEWKLQFPDKMLKTIAIVDNDPETQFLYPEFLLFKSLFKRHGIEALIGDPNAFTIKGSSLYLERKKIDIVYNRLTDFYLEEAESLCLKEAYQKGFALFTPSPHAYGLLGDKRNLQVLSDTKFLRQIGIDEERIKIISKALPTAVIVSQDNASDLWERRKQLFFKPINGFGSRGAYRGAKLTRRVWENIINSDYIAQTIIPPSERVLIIDGEKRSLKVDIRCVSYNGKVQQVSARLYQGQTTNLRTQGGGLATVFSTPEVSCC